MDIKEIKALKQETEGEIKRLLQAFSHRTGCRVIAVETQEIDTTTIMDRYKQHRVSRVDLDIRI